VKNVTFLAEVTTYRMLNTIIECSCTRQRSVLTWHKASFSR